MRARARRPPRRPRRPTKTPRNSARLAKSPRPPRAVEHFLAVAFRQEALRLCKIVRTLVLPRAGEFTDREEEGTRTDAKEKKDAPKAKEAKALADRVRRAYKPDAVRIGAASSTAASRATKHSENEFKRLGIDVKKEPAMKWLVDGWRKDNVARITKMTDDQLDKVETILREGWGRRPESIAEDLERQLGITESRAELIARDQILTINAQITRERQTAAGIEGYIWTTSNDERVRDEHRELEGQFFTWEEGHPEEGHPGEPINCRCVAFPVLPELEGGDEE